MQLTKGAKGRLYLNGEILNTGDVIEIFVATRLSEGKWTNEQWVPGTIEFDSRRRQYYFNAAAPKFTLMAGMMAQRVRAKVPNSRSSTASGRKTPISQPLTAWAAPSGGERSRTGSRPASPTTSPAGLPAGCGSTIKEPKPVAPSWERR